MNWQIIILVSAYWSNRIQRIEWTRRHRRPISCDVYAANWFSQGHAHFDWHVKLKVISQHIAVVITTLASWKIKLDWLIDCMICWLFGLLLRFVIVAPVVQASSRGHMSMFGSSKNSTSEFCLLCERVPLSSDIRVLQKNTLENNCGPPWSILITTCWCHNTTAHPVCLLLTCPVFLLSSVLHLSKWIWHILLTHCLLRLYIHLGGGIV